MYAFVRKIKKCPIYIILNDFNWFLILWWINWGKKTYSAKKWPARLSGPLACHPRYIDKIVIVYLDDIFIFNKTLEKYKEYIYFILIILEQANLYINIYKSTFYNQKIDYLRFKISSKTIEMNNKKIETIKYWL